MRRHASWSIAALLLLHVPSSAAPASTPAARTTELGRGPTVVIVHALGSTRTAWLPTARKLIASHRVVLVDLPGHGETALPDPFTLDAAAAAVGQVLATQKPESTIIVGQGAGGVLAMLALAAQPGRARGLVVIDAPMRFEPRIPDQQQRLFMRSFEERYDDMLKMMFGPLARDSAQAVRIHAQAAQTSPVTIKSYFREALNFDGTKALKSISAPVLYIGSGKSWDAGVPWGTFAKQRGLDANPAIVPRRIANSGSMIASDQPDTLAQALAAFTARALAKR